MMSRSRHSAFLFGLLLIGVILHDVTARDYSSQRPNSTGRDITQTNDFVILSKMSPFDGERICRNYGDGLAIVKTVEQRQKVLDFIGTLGEADKLGYWVGASDIGKSAGDFYWRDGEKMPYFLWGPNEPNHFEEGQKTCVYIEYPYGYLRDWCCTGALLRPICHLSHK